MDSTIHSKNATNVVNEKQIKFYYTSFPWVPTVAFLLSTTTGSIGRPGGGG